MQRCENLSVKGGLVIAREIATQSKHIGPGPIVMASNNFSIVAANVCAVAEFTCKTGLVSKTCNHRNVPLKPLPRQLPLAPSHFCLLSFVASTRIYPQQAAKEYTKPYIANPTKLPWTPLVFAPLE
jgi:hypothetical protein